MASSFEQSTTKTPKKQKIRTVIRNAAEQDWTGANVIPDKGELVYASDVNTLKIGDGITDYVNLPAISGGGSSGTTDYTNLINKPQIDGVTLVGNKTAADLGFATVATSGSYTDLIDKPEPTISTTTGTVALADNTIFNGDELSTLTITNPTSPTVDFSCQVNFTSGATPTTVTASNIVWVGDNVSETVGFVPRANCRYTVMFMYDGSNIRGIIQGVSL